MITTGEFIYDARQKTFGHKVKFEGFNVTTFVSMETIMLDFAAFLGEEGIPPDCATGMDVQHFVIGYFEDTYNLN